MYVYIGGLPDILVQILGRRSEVIGENSQQVSGNRVLPKANHFAGVIHWIILNGVRLTFFELDAERVRRDTAQNAILPREIKGVIADNACYAQKPCFSSSANCEDINEPPFYKCECPDSRHGARCEFMSWCNLGGNDEICRLGEVCVETADLVHCSKSTEFNGISSVAMFEVNNLKNVKDDGLAILKIVLKPRYFGNETTVQSIISTFSPSSDSDPFEILLEVPAGELVIKFDGNRYPTSFFLPSDIFSEVNFIFDKQNSFKFEAIYENIDENSFHTSGVLEFSKISNPSNFTSPLTSRLASTDSMLVVGSTIASTNLNMKNFRGCMKDVQIGTAFLPFYDEYERVANKSSVLNDQLNAYDFPKQGQAKFLRFKQKLLRDLQQCGDSGKTVLLEGLTTAVSKITSERLFTTGNDDAATTKVDFDVETTGSENIFSEIEENEYEITKLADFTNNLENTETSSVSSPVCNNKGFLENGFCSCKPLYFGDDCEYLDMCQYMLPCSRNDTCYNVPDRSPKFICLGENEDPESALFGEKPTISSSLTTLASPVEEKTTTLPVLQKSVTKLVNNEPNSTESPTPTSVVMSTSQTIQVTTPVQTTTFLDKNNTTRVTTMSSLTESFTQINLYACRFLIDFLGDFEIFL